MNENTLKEHFDDGFAVFTSEGEIESLLSFMHEDGKFIADDTPFILDRAQLEDQLRFHADKWERHYLTVRDLKVQVFGSTGMISGAYQDRGKPVDAGYRQRDGLFSVVCTWDESAGRWRALKVHMNTLLSAIHHSSPG